MLEMAREIHPALIGLEQDVVVGGRVELRAGLVQRRHAGVAAAREVDGRKVERQAEQVVAQCAGHELVDLVADLTCHAADDRAGSNPVVDNAVRPVERGRVEEALDQADVIGVEVRIEPVDRFGQHGVTEAVDHVGELGHDRRVHRGIEPVRNQEGVDLRLDLARELLEHEVLVLHLGAELGGLEQALAIPHESICTLVCGGRSAATSTTSHSFRNGECRPVAEGHFLGMLDEPVVLGMEHVVDGGQADVLVGAPVAGDEVRVEQLVVVFGVAVARIGQADGDVAVGDLADRHRLVGDVGEESTGRADAPSL